MTKMLKEYILAAENKFKQYADSYCPKKRFKVDDFVLLKLQPYWQSPIAARKSLQLSAEFYGTFRVIL